MRPALYYLLLLCSFSSWAAGPSIHFDSLSKGLSHPSVNSISQDNKGFMWFGTYDGLNRYDGYEFKVYRHDPDDPDSIADNFVLAVFEDSNQNLWIGTRGGLDRFDAKQERFIHYRHDPQDATSLSHNYVSAIIEDSRGVLWVGTLGGGLHTFDPHTGIFEKFQYAGAAPSSLNHEKINVIIEDSNGVIWFGTDNHGLNRYDPVSNQLSQFRHQPANPRSIAPSSVISIFEDSNKVLWVGTFSGGLNKYDASTDSFIHYSIEEKGAHRISHNHVRTVHEDAAGAFWIGTSEGMERFDENQGRFVRHNFHESLYSNVNIDAVFSLYNDKNNMSWIGTNSGVFIYNPDKDKFVHFRHQVADANSLSSNNVKGMLIDSNGDLWVGTATEGLNKYNEDLKKFKHFKHNPNDLNSLSNNDINDVYEDSRGNIWVATEKGMNKIAKGQGRVERYQHNPLDPNSLSDNSVRVFFEDNKGQFWIGTRKSGLEKLDRKTGVFTHYKNDPLDENSISDDFVMALFQDSRSNFWIGTLGGGLNLFYEEEGRFKHYKHDKKNLKSLSHDVVFSILEDQQGRLWIGTSAGLNRYDYASDSFEVFNESHGLINNVILGILEDDSGDLWLSTNKGLSRFNPSTKTFKNYDVSDGLQGKQFGVGAYYRSTEGELFFGGTEGFNRFFPHEIQEENQELSVVFTDFLLFNDSVPIEKGEYDHKEGFHLHEAIEYADNIVLTHNESLISIEFSALDYRNPEKIHYAYKLEGWDENWIFTDASRRFATYTKLSAGDYTFMVKASNDSGDWSGEATSLKIKVLPAPWFSWWAYILYVLIIMASIALFVHSERKSFVKERAVNRRLKQLDSLKDEFLANTSHELRTPLNGIIGLAESLVDGVAGPLPSKANQNLAMIVSGGKRLSNLVNDILDFSKLKTRNLDLKLKPIDLFSVVDVVMTLLQPLVGSKKLLLINGVDETLPAIKADEDRLLQILLNLVGNAIKFTDEGTVTVRAKVHEQSMHISVADTGIGIAQEQLDTIFESFEQVEGHESREYEGTGLGLAISKQLVELHGGTLSVSSTLGKGSEFTFNVFISSEVADKNAKNRQTVSRLHVLEHEITSTGSLSTQSQSDSKQKDFSILIVDDEPVNRQVLCDYLSMQNYHLLEASSGADALAILDGERSVDLVLLDIMMPKMSGYEVCEKIRKSHTLSELPVIFLTAKNQVADLVQSFSVGANDYLSKPVAKHELLTRVETHLNLVDVNRNLEDKVSQRTVALQDATNAKSEFLARMSHEIRTPLTSVIGYAESILAGEIKGSEQLHAIATIGDSGKHLLELINDILDLTKIEANKLAIERIATDLFVLLAEVRNLMHERAKQKGLEFNLSYEFPLPSVIVTDPTRLKQILLNLCGNAIKFTQEGRVDVTVSCTHESLFFAVADTGIGIANSELENLFHAFEQGDMTISRRFGGTGLGLNISQHLAQRLGGNISVESELNQGSCFTASVSLELATNSHPIHDLLEVKREVRARYEKQTVTSQIKGRVLLAEDQDIIRRLMTQMLKQLGLQVRSVENGLEMVELACNEEFDLILSDINMPVMGGIEGLRKLKAAGCNTPVVALTANAMSHEVQSYLDEGFVAHLAKPIDRDKFTQVLSTIINAKHS